MAAVEDAVIRAFCEVFDRSPVSPTSVTGHRAHLINKSLSDVSRYLALE